MRSGYYNAGIGANGEIRPLYNVQKELGRIIAKYPWLAEAEREGDCRLAIDFEHPRSEKYWRSHAGFLLTGTEAWNFLKRGVLSSAFCGSLSPVLCNIDDDDWVADLSTPVMVVSAAVMSKASQQRLVKFLRAGGQALILPVLPTVDENMEPCTLLADFLGAAALRKKTAQAVRVNVAGVINISNTGEVYFTDQLPAGATVVGEDELTHSTLAWKKTFRGGGAAIFLGFRWNHSVHEHWRMLAALLQDLGMKQRVFCSNPNIWTSLRTAGKKKLLFLMNLHSSPQETHVSCRPRGRGKTVDLGKHRLPAMNVQLIEIA